MMKFNLARNIKGDKKGFYRYVNNRRKAKENVGPLQKETDLVTQDTEKAEVLNYFFASIFANRC